MTHKEKQDLRERIKTLLRNQEDAALSEKSQQIADKFFSLSEYKQAKSILFFASFGKEVNTFPMMERALAEGKNIALPTINKSDHTFRAQRLSSLDDLEDGPYGIKQIKESAAIDVSPEELDLVVVPALAIDKSKNRLGRGGGYYDRFLQGLPKDTPTVGLVFDVQLLETLPTDTHDVMLTHVLTN